MAKSGDAQFGKSQTLMVQGCTSDAGKSMLVTALGRVFHRQGIAVAPFKSQNMALNSAVTEDGGEIGRAQAVQAYACGVAPHVDMNPVLLKPHSDIGAQVIIQGKAVSNMEAQTYHDYKKVAMAAVLESHQRLVDQYDLVVVEGAGSPAEINLRENDIANMGFAEEADCPVILIADIDKGGVFAHLVGTLDLLSESEQNRVVGFVINRFRGDIKLLESGLDWLEDRTGKPVLGVLPYLHGLHLEAEDGIDQQQVSGSSNLIRVLVPVLPHISNHTDFDPLRLHPEVDLQFVGPNAIASMTAQELAADLIILPGSKSVIADLKWLNEQGWKPVIDKHLRYGGKLLGICGGYQMLGMEVTDPDGIEGETKAFNGLGYLDIKTRLLPQKQLRNVAGQFQLIGEGNQTCNVSGYEIHAGVTEGQGIKTPLISDLNNELTEDGAQSSDGRVIGTYLHGLFESTDVLQQVLKWVSGRKIEAMDYEAQREAGINRVADAVEQNLDLDTLSQLMKDF